MTNNTIIHESPFHRFRGFKQEASASLHGGFRYELEVRLPLGLGWYNVFHLDAFQQSGENLADIERYLWRHACIGIVRDFRRTTSKLETPLP